MYTRRYVALAGLAVLGGLTSAARADVRLELRPLLTQAACVGQEFEVGLFASTTNPALFATGEGFAGLQVVLAWDPTVLELIGASTDDSPITWSLREFLPGDAAGLNEAEIPKDGDAFYLLTVQLSNTPPLATQAGVLTAAFRFKAIVQTNTPTAISILSDGGTPPNVLSTRVADAINPGLNILDSTGGGIVTQFTIPVTCTRTLDDLEIQGPPVVPAGSTGQCRAIASFLEGFSLDVTFFSFWEILSGPGTIDPDTGVYTAPGTIQGSAQVRVKVTFEDQGTTLMAEKTFTVVEQQDDRNPTGLVIDGPSIVDENGSGQCTATASFSNAPSANVTSSPGIIWRVILGPGTFSSTSLGLYLAPDVSQDRQVIVEAEFTENGVTVTAQKSFIVRDLTVQVPEVTGLTIVGPVVVAVGRVVNYTAIAFFSNGSQTDVTLTSSWIVLSGPGFLNAFVPGEYNAPSSVPPSQVTIQAFFTDATGSVDATLDITVVEPEPAVDLILRPSAKQGDVGDIFRCELYAISNAPFAQRFHATDVILAWDPFFLEFIRAERLMPNIFSTAGIFPGDLHNCNEADPPADGTALFTGRAPLANPVIATPYAEGGTLIAFIVLRAVSPGTSRVEVLKNGCDEIRPSDDKETTVVDSTNPGLNITGIVGFSQITVSGDPGGGPVVVISRLPLPDSVLNRHTDPVDTTNAGGRVSVLFNAPTTNVNIQVVGVRNGLQTGVPSSSNGGQTHTLSFSPALPDRDRYNVTVRVNGIIVAEWSFGKLVGDCNRNGTVEILDAGQMRSALRTSSYNPNCDFNGDGVNNILDLLSLRIALKEGAFLPLP